MSEMPYHIDSGKFREAVLKAVLNPKSLIKKDLIEHLPVMGSSAVLISTGSSAPGGGIFTLGTWLPTACARVALHIVNGLVAFWDL